MSIERVVGLDRTPRPRPTRLNSPLPQRHSQDSSAQQSLQEKVINLSQAPRDLFFFCTSVFSIQVSSCTHVDFN